LSLLGSQTYEIQRPGSNVTPTDMGIWAAVRYFIDGQTKVEPEVTLLYMNDNTTTTYKGQCTTKDKALITPYESGTMIRNLFHPYENYTLIAGPTAGSGCIPEVTMDAFGFKAFVPAANWHGPRPMITGFLPGHDARLQAESGAANATSIPIEIQFNMAMDCDSVSKAVSFTMSSSKKGSAPTFSTSAVKCGPPTNPVTSQMMAVDTSAWSWAVTLTGVPDGVLTINVDSPENADHSATTNVRCLLVSLSDPI
jgi:alpha-1,3-glucan synthase